MICKKCGTNGVFCRGCFERLDPAAKDEFVAKAAKREFAEGLSTKVLIIGLVAIVPAMLAFAPRDNASYFLASSLAPFVLIAVVLRLATTPFRALARRALVASGRTPVKPKF
ncbi:MAG: hypothetical protein Kow0069_18040 [Promethearchaeota archaeon]